MSRQASYGSRYEPRIPGAETKSWVWIKCDLPVVARGLLEIVKSEVDAYCADNPSRDRPPSCVILCTEEARLTEEIGAVRAQAPEAFLLVVGYPGDLAMARSAIRAGTQGFMHVGMQPSQLRRALSLAAQGEVVIPRELVPGIVGREETVEPEMLTFRQREILQLVAEGKTNAQIADTLYLSEYTVKQHLRAAFKALNVRNRVEAVRRLKHSYDN